MHFLQAINSDLSVLIVCNKTGGTIKGDIKKKFMLGTAISYTEACEKGLNKIQKFVSPVTEQLHAWLADTWSETGQFTEFTYEIINSSFSLSPFPQFTPQYLRAHKLTHGDSVRLSTANTGRKNTSYLNNSAEESFLRRWSAGQEIALIYGT